MKRFLLFVFLASATGARAQSSDMTTGVLVLTPRVKIALFSERALDASNINVDTNDATRTVTLSGRVTSQAQKSLAESIAKSNSAGYQVRDCLAIHRQTVEFRTGIPLQYKRASEFLRVLSASQARSGADGVRKTAFSPRDVERILSFISPRGLTIEDVWENGGRPLILSKERLKRDLKRTGSSAFDSFAFAGGRMRLQVGVPVSSRPTSKGVTIGMPSGFWFIWEREGAARKLFLRKLIYQSRST